MKTKLFISGSRCRLVSCKHLLLLIMLAGSFFFTETAFSQITLVSGSPQSSTTTSTTISLAKPSGLALGDVMLVSINQSNGSTGQALDDATSSGWTEVAGNYVFDSNGQRNRATILGKVATATDVAATSYSFTLDGQTDGTAGAIIAFRGVDTVNGVGGPFDIAPTNFGSASAVLSTMTAPSITTATANAAVIMFATIGDDLSFSSWTATNPGLTEIFDVPYNVPSVTNDASIGAAWGTRTTAGATGSGTVTLSGSTRGSAIFVALRRFTGSVTVGSVVSSLCAGTTFSLPYTISGTYGTGNVFTAQLSNASGSFASPTTIGSATSTSAGNISVTIPAAASGSGYRIRIMASSPAYTSADNGSDIAISIAPTAVVGGAFATCSSAGAINITSGASVTNTSSVVWSTPNGLGTISNPNSLTTATYTPSASDPASVTLTLTAFGSPCANATASRTLTVYHLPTASAGGSATICASQTVQVSGASASNGTISWTENGAGSITAGATTLTPTYTPAAGDAGNVVTLTMTVSNPQCTAATATYTVQVVGAAAASAGSAITTCSSSGAVNITTGSTAGNYSSVQWTSNGLGTIANSTSMTNATYTPSPSDAQTVTLTLKAFGNSPCGNATSTKTLTVYHPPTAIAGGSATTCSNQAVTVTGASASNGTISWTENGAGSITAGGTTVSPTYTPAAGDAGNTVTLTMTVSNPSCNAATATFTINVFGVATANAGTAVSTCANGNPVNISAGASATNNSGVQWSSNGTGTFSAENSLSSTYTPSAADMAAGSVTLTLTALGNSPCANATSTKVLTLNPVPSPVVLTPSSAAICPGSVVEIAGNGGLNAVQPYYTENFNGTLTFTATGSSSGADSAAFTNRTSPFTAVTTSFSSPDASKFMLAHIGSFFGTASSNSTLTSSPINTTGLSALSLSFNHSYKKGDESGVTVQVSTNGSTWTTVKTYSANAGGASSFASDNINLDAYINQPSLRVRFNYTGNLGFGIASGWWAIDQVVLSAPQPSMVWSPLTGLYTNAAATVAYTGGSAPKIYAKPTTTTTYTATSTSAFGCGSTSNTITIQVNRSTLSGVSQAAVVCQNTAATIQLSGLIANSVSDISYTIGGGVTQTALAVAANSSGNASFNANVSLANNGQTLAITNISRNDVSPVCGFVPTSNNTVVLAVNANVTYYVDNDSDSYGNAAASQVSCFGAPSGYVADNTDCNDSDATMHTTFAFYMDADHDGFGTGALRLTCAANASTPPVGYSLNNSDCNDSDASIHAAFDFFVDADGDGFGSATIQSVCAVDASTPPAGFSLNGTDCSDLNSAIHAEFQFYVDADQDTFGTGSLVNVCALDANTPPTGYSLNATDCNDNAFAINPGHAEVLYNGVDDNCDGTLDENFQLLSQILPSQAGTTLTTISSVIAAVSFAQPVTGYRFRVVNTTTLAVQTIDRTAPHFQLTSLPNYDYATTYSISVQLQRSGIWLGYYGPSALVSTPAVLDSGGATQISASQCGSTLPTISTLIATTSLNGVTGYRFRVTNISNPLSANQVQIIDRNLHWFSLTMLPEFAYGTTYMIEVAVKTNGTFSGFGSPCQVSSPPVPTLSQCGETIQAAGTHILTSSLNRVTSYRFEVTDMSTFQVIAIDRNQNWFTFNMVGAYTPAGQMAVRVAVMTAGVWSDFGEACMITAPGAARQSVKDEQDAEPQIAFRAVSYPNPYTDTFSIDVDLPSSANVDVKIYDMMGKLVETRAFDAIDTEIQTFGSKLAAGVYNVVVSQGANVKTLRVVKR